MNFFAPCQPRLFFCCCETISHFGYRKKVSCWLDKKERKVKGIRWYITDLSYTKNSHRHIHGIFQHAVNSCSFEHCPALAVTNNNKQTHLLISTLINDQWSMREAVAITWLPSKPETRLRRHKHCRLVVRHSSWKRAKKKTDRERRTKEQKGTDGGQW